jgi:phage protein D
VNPVCIITIDGRPASNLFWQRLISVTVTDKEGSSSDTIDLSLNAGMPPDLAIPRRGAIITCQMGPSLGDLADFGTFTADDVTLHFLPYKIDVQGKAADMRASLKEHKSRHFDGETFGGVVQKMAGEHGLAAQVDPEIAAFAGREGYFLQEGESDLHWIERQARRLNGLFTIKNGRLIIAKKGAGMTAGGAALGGLVVTPGMVVEGTGSVTFAEREGHKTVRAAWHDTAEGVRKYEEAEANPEAEATYILRHDHTTQDAARRAAESRAKELQRQAETTSVTINGNTAARGGAPMSYAGIHPQVDGQPFIIESAAHSFSKGGYTVQISAKKKV